jgi:pentafunctional AROM polypeptide
MGMRGAGKTTLGRLAAEHLKTPFIDADVLFEDRHRATPKAFVAEHGWPAFRAAETAILKELLQSMGDRTKGPQVVSLGGGVVESNENREMLKKCWRMDAEQGAVPYDALDRQKGVAVIHIFREVDKVLMDRRGLPSWTGMANGEEVWQRRRPWFRESSSHEFVNFTDGEVMEHADAFSTPDVESSRAARMRFEAVERDFVRFLSRVLYSFGVEATPYLPSKTLRSYLVTFPFADLKPHVDKLPLITLGADAVELRADLLSDPSKTRTNDNDMPQCDVFEAYENPSLSFVSEQVALVRRHLPRIPLVFTLRTPAQGGRYPYPADAPTEALFTTLRHALKLGCEVIDIEMGMDTALTHALISDAKQRRITVLISWRDKVASTDGGFTWASEQAGKLYEDAVRMGADLVKIVGTAGQVSDNFALRMFAASVEGHESSIVPLSAYNMGNKGRISRFLNPTLASITHPIAKQHSGHGIVGNPSMTFQEIQKALHLSGLTEKASFIVIQNGKEEVSIRRCQHWFSEMGLPFHIQAATWPEDGIASLSHSINPHLGVLRGIAFPHGVNVTKLQAAHGVQGDANVQASGHLDCIVLAHDGNHMASNKLVEALEDLITSSISPSVHLSSSSSCIVIGTHVKNVYEAAALRAVEKVGLDTASVSDKRRGLDDGNKPTVVINCHNSTSAIDEELFANENGGVYVDVVANENAQRVVNQKRFRDAGWRSITAKTLWRHVDALRYQAFTGRRAPSELSDPLTDGVL